MFLSIQNITTPSAWKVRADIAHGEGSRPVDRFKAEAGRGGSHINENARQLRELVQ